MRSCLKATALIAIVFSAVDGSAAPAFTIETFAGTGQAGGDGDAGPAGKAQLNNPFGLTAGPDDALYVCEVGNHVIRRIARDGSSISTVAGTGKRGYNGDGGPALAADLNEPYEVRFDRRGNMYFVEMRNHIVRRVSVKDRTISTIAGTGQRGFAGDDGPAAQAQLNQPHSIQFGPDGDLFICDIGNHRVRQVDMKTGIITTVAGTGDRGPTPDGAPIEGTPLNGPRAIDFDAAGQMWLALREGNAVYRLDLEQGIIHHEAGSGKKGFSGNGGPAKEATLSGPKGISLGPNGNVYLADTESHSIRMIDRKSGLLRVIAGTGAPGDGPDGDPWKCRMSRPHGIFVDARRDVYIGDSEAHKVRVLRRHPSVEAIGKAKTDQESQL